jgi:hypothetical protein
LGIEKMRSKFFQRSKSSAGAVTLPAGSGGEANEVKRTIDSEGSEELRSRNADSIDIGTATSRGQF